MSGARARHAPDSSELPELSAQQRRVVDIVLVGKQSIFFTGSAGTGKSRTLHEIVRRADPSTTCLTALTGIAASALPKASTLHSFAGIGLGQGSPEQVLEFVRTNAVRAQGWKRCKLLVVDEASMMSQRLFELLEFIARRIRGTDKPFGGIQLCLCGDFFQLPPVSRGRGIDSRFCFESPQWSRCVNRSIELTTVYRQQDPQLLRLLREVRFNCVSEESINLLRALSRDLKVEKDILPTRLHAGNEAVDRINAQCLAGLAGNARAYRAEDSPPRFADQLNNLTLFPQYLELKVGAQVMMLKKFGELVNGSRGVVTAFEEHAGVELPIVRWLSGGVSVVRRLETVRETGQGVLRRLQLPLKLCWAMTIHKSQGMSVDLLQVDLANVFERGQAYVALSRARTLEGLQVCSFDARRFGVDPRVVEFYRGCERLQEEEGVAASGVGATKAAPLNT